MGQITPSQEHSDAITREVKRIREQTYADAEAEIRRYKDAQEHPTFFNKDNLSEYKRDYVRQRRCGHCNRQNYYKNVNCTECGNKI